MFHVRSGTRHELHAGLQTKFNDLGSWHVNYQISSTLMPIVLLAMVLFVRWYSLDYKF